MTTELDGADDPKKKDVRWQDYAASSITMSIVKVEDIRSKIHKIIGYHQFVAPKQFVAFDTEWNKLGIYETGDDAKHAVVDNYLES